MTLDKKRLFAKAKSLFFMGFGIYSCGGRSSSSSLVVLAM